jgi:Fructose-bisphosphate aldolase class-I
VRRAATPLQTFDGRRESVAAVATATLRVLRRHVPAAVPGIVFLSGGQDERRATMHLNAMNAGPEIRPWRVSFSYGRALQDPALEAWGGRASGVQAGQQALHHRARATARRAWAGTTNRWSETSPTWRWRRTGRNGPTTESRSMPMSTTRRASSTKDAAALLKQYGCGPIEFSGTDKSAAHLEALVGEAQEIVDRALGTS